MGPVCQTSTIFLLPFASTTLPLASPSVARPLARRSPRPCGMAASARRCSLGPMPARPARPCLPASPAWHDRRCSTRSPSPARHGCLRARALAPASARPTKPPCAPLTSPLRHGHLCSPSSPGPAWHGHLQLPSPSHPTTAPRCRRSPRPARPHPTTARAALPRRGVPASVLDVGWKRFLRL